MEIKGKVRDFYILALFLNTFFDIFSDTEYTCPSFVLTYGTKYTQTMNIVVVSIRRAYFIVRVVPQCTTGTRARHKTGTYERT